MLHLCSLCPKTFTQSTNLKLHLQAHSGEKPHYCEICKKSFLQKGYFDIHQRRHRGERPYSCQYCIASFSDSGSLRRHLKTHTDKGEGEKSFICTYCPKGFNQNENLKRHIRVHTGEKPYLCNECTKTFRDAGNLKKHMETHNNKEQYFLCNNCTKSFAQERYLKVHFLSVHKGEKYEGNNKRATLYSQEMIHEGERSPLNENSSFEILEKVGNLQLKKYENDKLIEDEISNVESNEIKDALELVKILENDEAKKDNKIKIDDMVDNIPIKEIYHSNIMIHESVPTISNNETKTIEKNINPIKTELLCINENIFAYGKCKIKKVDKRKINDEILENIGQKCEAKISDKTEYVYERYKNRIVQKSYKNPIENKLLYEDKNNFSYGKCKVKKIETGKNGKNEIMDDLREYSNKDTELKSHKEETLIRQEPLEEKLSLDSIKEDVSSVDCDLCSYKKINKEFYSQHMESAHKKCEECGYQSLNKTDMKSHMEKEHNKESKNRRNGEDVKIYHCSYCTESFEQHGLLLPHHLSKHNGEKYNDQYF